jgi:thiopeptide-type bacteriocin biosynthesis protein
MIRRCAPQRTSAPPLPASGGAPGFVPSLSKRAGDRLFPPGSEWIYLKLYCGSVLQDDLLVGPVPDLIHRLLGRELLQQWFFIRYADPDSHLRLRFRCRSPEPRLTLFSELCEWATTLLDDGLCSRIAFDTYDREIERYGGLEAISLAEQIFHVDAEAALEYLALLQQCRAIAPQDFVVATMDNLLSGLTTHEADMTRWLRTRHGDKRSSGSEYRKRQATLWSYLTRRDNPSASTLPPPMQDSLARTRQKLRPLGAALSELESRSLLQHPMENLLSSFAHVHFNRLLGMDAELERLTLSLLHRTREAIAHLAPSSSTERQRTCL